MFGSALCPAGAAAGSLNPAFVPVFICFAVHKPPHIVVGGGVGLSRIARVGTFYPIHDRHHVAYGEHGEIGVATGIFDLTDGAVDPAPAATIQAITTVIRELVNSPILLRSLVNWISGITANGN